MEVITVVRAEKYLKWKDILRKRGYLELEEFLSAYEQIKQCNFVKEAEIRRLNEEIAHRDRQIERLNEARETANAKAFECEGKAEIAYRREKQAKEALEKVIETAKYWKDRYKLERERADLLDKHLEQFL